MSKFLDACKALGLVRDFGENSRNSVNFYIFDFKYVFRGEAVVANISRYTVEECREQLASDIRYKLNATELDLVQMVVDGVITDVSFRVLDSDPDKSSSVDFTHRGIKYSILATQEHIRTYEPVSKAIHDIVSNIKEDAFSTDIVIQCVIHGGGSKYVCRHGGCVISDTNSLAQLNIELKAYADQALADARMFEAYMTLYIVMASFEDCFEKTSEGYHYKIPVATRSHCPTRGLTLGTTYLESDPRDFSTLESCMIRIVRDVGNLIPKEWRELARLIADDKLNLEEISWCPDGEYGVRAITKPMPQLSLIRRSKNNYINRFDCRDNFYREMLQDMRGMDAICSAFRIWRDLELVSHLKLQVEESSPTEVKVLATYCIFRKTYSKEYTLPKNWYAGCLIQLDDYIKRKLPCQCVNLIHTVEANPEFQVSVENVYGTESVLKIVDGNGKVHQVKVSKGKHGQHDYWGINTGVSEIIQQLNIATKILNLDKVDILDMPPPLEEVTDDEIEPSVACDATSTSVDSRLTFALDPHPVPNVFFRLEDSLMVGIYRVTNFDEINMIAEDAAQGSVGLRSRVNSVVVELDPVYDFRVTLDPDEWLKALFHLGAAPRQNSKFVVLTNPAHPESHQMALKVYQQVAKLV